MSRALLYDRVSSAKQALGYSLPTQNVACRAFCSQRGYTVVAEYEDAYTGTTHERPGLDALLDTLAADPVDVVVAYDLDRLLGRDELGQVLLKHAILETGARIEYVMGGSHDNDTTDGDLLVGFKALIARHENTQRTERIKRGQRGRITAGFPMVSGNGAPYGYTYEAQPHQGALVVRDDEAASVRWMFHLLNVEGLSSHAIAQRLHAAGIPTRGDERRDAGLAVKKSAGACVWNPATVKKILRSALYRGEYTYGTTKRVKRPSMTKPDGTRYSTRYAQVPTDPSQWLSVDVPAIVDDATWERAQARLTENKRFCRPATHDYLLRAMLVCPSCGSRWHGAPGSGTNVYYKCPNASGHGWRPACDAGYFLRQEPVETAVWNYVIQELLHPERMMGEVERRRQAEAGERAIAERELRAVEAELSQIDRRLASLLDQVLDGFPANVVETKKRELLDARERMEQERKRLTREQSPAMLTPQTVVQLRELAGIVQAAAGTMTFDERRQLLRMLQIEVDVLDAATVRVRGLVSPEVLSTSFEQRSHYPTMALPFDATLGLDRAA